MSCEEFNFSESNSCTHAVVGADFIKEMTVLDESGSAEDITGQTFELNIVDSIGGTLLLALNNTLVNGDTGFYISDAANGKVNMTITDTDTISVGEGVFYYDFYRTDSGGRKILEGYGTFQFTDRSVT